jgi:hypothetical protein
MRWLRRLIHAPKPPKADEENLISSINESARSIGLQWITLLLTGCYLGISAAEVTDQAFLFRDQTSLPHIDVKIGVDTFFILSPLLLVILHLALLGKEFFLLLRVSWLPWKKADIDISRFASPLSVGRHFSGELGPVLGILQHAVFWIVCVLFPPLLLMHLQMRSLRHRVPFITDLIGWTIVVDLFALVAFITASWLTKSGNRDLWEKGPAGCWRSLIKVFLVLLSFGACVWFLGAYVSFLHRDVGCRRSPDRFLGVYPVRRYLVLNQSALSSRVPESRPAASAREVREPREELGKGMDFRGRDLRCADFSGAPLMNADFRGAVLKGAIFDRADLRNAVFAGRLFNSALEWEELDRPADLESASFEEADLTRASLADTNLRWASFESAFLQEANLAGADLSGARAFRARLLAARLTGAILRGADFREARLPYADLSGARLELARFAGTQLDGVSFVGAHVSGADFRNARMRGANGLSLRAINLRGAGIWALNGCDAKDSALPFLVDFRAVSFDPVEWDALSRSFRFRARTPLLQATWRKMRKPPGATCLSPLPLSRVAPRQEQLQRAFQEQYLLYDGPKAATPFADWPARSEVTEKGFYRRMAQSLVDRACSEQSGRIDRPAGVPLMVLLAQRAEEDDLFGGLLAAELRNAPCEIR